MKSILLISTIYPRPEGNIGTRVCHYFTREWVKAGYTVQAVHIQAVYPKVFYWIAKLAQKKIAAKASAVVYTKRDDRIEHYEMDDVPICRIPVYKPIPHGAFSKKAVIKAVATIVENNKKAAFKPNIIIGHFPNPQLELLYDLKQVYPDAKICEVLHLPEELDQLESVYRKNLRLYMDSVDVWGFRFKYLKELFENKYGQAKNSFICYSGVPESFISDDDRVLKSSFDEFLFVGEMIERKYPVNVLDALIEAYPQRDFHINYIGDGGLKKSIQNRIKEEHLEQSVSVLGKIPRDEIKQKYDEADCFIMISKCEAFGLVYLEAMARGCITIASRNEGIDGVIVDGENGFLCEAGNYHELAAIINKIKSLSPQERKVISMNARQTALRLTDKKAAGIYLKNIKNCVDYECKTKTL